MKSERTALQTIPLGMEKNCDGCVFLILVKGWATCELGKKGFVVREVFDSEDTVNGKSVTGIVKTCPNRFSVKKSD